MNEAGGWSSALPNTAIEDQRVDSVWPLPLSPSDATMGSMEPEVVTGLFTLGGVMLGSGVRRRLEWARIRGTDNRAKDATRMHGGGRPNDDLPNFLAVCDSMVAVSSIGTKLAVDESNRSPLRLTLRLHAPGHYAAAWKADFRPALGQGSSSEPSSCENSLTASAVQSRIRSLRFVNGRVCRSSIWFGVVLECWLTF